MQSDTMQDNASYGLNTLVLSNSATLAAYSQTSCRIRSAPMDGSSWCACERQTVQKKEGVCEWRGVDEGVIYRV